MQRICHPLAPKSQGFLKVTYRAPRESVSPAPKTVDGHRPPGLFRTRGEHGAEVPRAKSVKKFASKGFFKTVDLHLLDRLLEPYSDDLPFTLIDLPQDEKAKREALYGRFLAVDETFPPDLLDALHCIVQLSDKQGLHCLHERADLAGVQLAAQEETRGEPDGRHLHPQHVALRAYLDHREVFDQAIDFRAFIQPSSPAEFNGAREGVDCRHDDPKASKAFRQAVSGYFSQRYMGRYCEVRWYPEEDEINILILHGRHMMVTPVEERGEERVLRFRELRQDTIRYTPATGRLRTSAEHPREREQLKKLFAEHLIGEPDFFDGEDSENLYTLQPVHEQGADFELEIDWDDDLEKVRIVEVQIAEQRAPDKRRRAPWALTIRDARNPLRRATQMMRWLDFRSQEITYLKLEFTFRLHGKPRRIMVKIKPPRTVSFRRDVFETKIMEHLRRNGLCVPRPTLFSAAAD